MNYPIELSEKILNNLKSGIDTKELRRELYFIRANRLNNYLFNDDLKKQFWLNIYNAYFLILKNENAVKSKTFDSKRVRVGYNNISLNDIEYQIFKNKGVKNYWGIKNLFSSDFIKQVAIKTADKSVLVHLPKNID